MGYSKETKIDEYSVAISSQLFANALRWLQNPGDNSGYLVGYYNPSIGTHRFTAVICHFEFELSSCTQLFSEENNRVDQIIENAVTRSAGIVIIRVAIPNDTNILPMGLNIPVGKNVGSISLPLIEIEVIGDSIWKSTFLQFQNGWTGISAGAINRIVGSRLNATFDDEQRPKPEYREQYKRTVTVWGKQNHDQLARLRIGIVGLGSVGSLVAECLARMGIQRFVLVDFDEVQVHNLDRITGAFYDDIGKLKIDVAARTITSAATGKVIEVRKMAYAVTEESGYLSSLDCDVVFSCVDRPWARQVLNHIAYAHLIPVIDGGIRVRFDKNTRLFDGAEWQAHIATPHKACLQCLGQFESSDVETERAGLLEDPSYLDGLEIDHSFKQNENVFPFSMNLASLEILQFIEMITSIGEIEGDYGSQRYSYNHGIIRIDHRKCSEHCLYNQSISAADSLFPAPVGVDHAAVGARKRQAESKRLQRDSSSS